MQSWLEAAILFPLLISRDPTFFIETRTTSGNNCVVGFTPFLSFDRPIHRVHTIPIIRASYPMSIGVNASRREAAIQIPLLISRVPSFL
jgi:hypothetical protein